MHYTTFTLGAISVLSGIVRAGTTPQMGGNMSHLLVSIFDQQVFIGFESPAMAMVELQESSSLFDGDASVLNHTGHNAQFGWLVGGFISLPSNSGVFVRTLGGSEHLSVHSEFGYDPILGTDGSDAVWQWDGTMTHNWYSSEVKGPHSVRYEVFVGDLMGNPLDGWAVGQVELNFVYGEDMSDRIHVLNTGSSGGLIGSVPNPSSIAGLGLAGLLTVRRRR